MIDKPKKYFQHPFLYIVQICVLLVGALFFSGGCPTETNEEPPRPRPSIPRYFSIISMSENSLRIDWSKEGYYDKSYYKVERADSTLIFEHIGTTQIGFNYFVDTTVSNSNIYFYRVQSIMDSLVSSYSEIIKVGYSKTIQLLRVLQTNSAIVRIATTSDGRYLISSCSDDSIINVWDTSNWSLRKISSGGNRNGTYSFALTKDSKSIIIGGYNNIKIRNLLDGTLIRTINTDSAYTGGLVLVSDENELITSDIHGKLRLFEFQSGRFIRNLDSTQYGGWGLAASPKSNVMVACSYLHLSEWNMDTRTVKKRIFEVFSGPMYSNDGTLLAVTTVDAYSICKVFNTSDWTVRYTYDKYVMSTTFSPDGRTQLIGDLNKIQMIDVLTGKVVQTLAAHSNRVVALEYFQDGDTFASGSWDNTIKIWSLTQDEQWHILE